MAETKQVSQLEPEAMLLRFKSWWRQDSRHSAKWRKEARDDFAFTAGDQWSQEDKSALESQGRVPITFNLVSTLIEAVAGIEINGRHETTYLPRGTRPGAVQKNELLSGASRWMDDESDAPTSQSQAFQDTIKCGMGWTEAKLAYDEEADGAYDEPHINPLEMWWDHKARKPNVRDARRLWHARAAVDIDEARELFPDASDEDLHAAWCDPQSTDDPKAKEEKRKRDAENSEDHDDDTVTLVRVQWIESEPYYRAIVGGKVVELSAKKLKALNKALEKKGEPAVRAVKMSRKVYKQAFIGARVLSEAPYDAPCPHFTFNCVTGRLHEIEGTWYGITKRVRDPQMWTNKWLTQTLHIHNTQGRGVMYEEDAPADIREFEQDFARPDKLVRLKKGGIAKIAPKPAGAIGSGHMELMQFAISSIRDASGINLEILGLREANQPGVLEAQRKQAGMTILATLFDSLRAFRKRNGKVRLYYIQEYLSDGRLIRLAAPGGEEYVPLIQDKVAGRYDIIVGDAPTSPNMREQVWAQLQPLLAMYKDAIPPELMLELLEYSPLPSAVVERIKKAVAEAQQRQQQDPEAQEQKQIAKRGAIAKVEETEAKAGKLRAETESIPVDDAVKVADAERSRTHPQRGPEMARAA